jgi:two-component system, chemotaxis family, chemotaxis protein CheY
MSRRILVVDDSPTLRRLAANTLRAAGYDVIEAEHGQEGLDRLQQEVSEIHAVVTDLNMPIMDGLTLTERVRTNPATSAMPVLMVTTEASPEMRKKGRAAGATGWITKPYNPKKLVSSVRRICL